MYQKRGDVLLQGLCRAGWPVEAPRGSMFVWAPLPERYRHLGSLEFSKLLLEKALVAVSPGVGFGPLGEGYVRFALIENPHRTRQATRSIAHFLRSEERRVGKEGISRWSPNDETKKIKEAHKINRAINKRDKQHQTAP